MRIDPGESEAISLALSEKADLLLVDDLGARHAAARLGIRITGTLGVLERADAANLLMFDQAAALIRASDFKISQRLLDAASQRVRARRHDQSFGEA